MNEHIRNAGNFILAMVVFLAPLWLLLAVVVGIATAVGFAVALMLGKFAGILVALLIVAGSVGAGVVLTNKRC